MRRWALNATAIVLLLLAPSTAATSDGREFGVLDAALTLAEIAKLEGRADMLLSAAQVVAELSPRGASEWVGEALHEARFAARGDLDILARAAAIKLQSEAGTLELVQMAPSGLQVVLPSGMMIGRVRQPLGSELSHAASSGGQTCRLAGARVVDCSASSLTGKVHFTVLSGSGAGVLVLELVPLVPE